MNRVRLLAGVALALSSGWALAQKAPESLLPPGFDDPVPPRAAPAPTPAPRPASSGASAGTAASSPAAGGTGSSSTSTPVVQPIPSGGSAPAVAGSGLVRAPGGKILTLEELEKLSPEDLEEALGIKPKFDIPPAARRSMQRVGVLDESEGGLSAGLLNGQNASLVRAALAGNSGMLVSRWGHILLRRALASRLDAPAAMNPADFAALRAALLLRMGEGEAARALVQDIDTGNYSPALTQAAFDAYVATADITGVCPAVAIQGAAISGPEWDLVKSICTAFQGDGMSALSQLDRALGRGAMPKIDVVLAQKYAGAAGKARRAVRIEWDDVKDITPWRYGLTVAVGLQPPEALMKDAGPRYDYLSATAPMLGLASRAAAADRAGGAGVLSSAAMVDLYSQIYADDSISGDWADRADQLREAYVAADPGARLAAMEKLWSGASGPQQRYSRQVLTAYAAARLPVDPALADKAPDLIASMLAAGLDANALRWADEADVGTQAWALLILAAPSRSQPVTANAVEGFRDNDGSEKGRKSAFLLAGLAALGRVAPDSVGGLASTFEVDLSRQTRWTRMIDKAAEVNNPALVALLAGLGMQGDSWAKMTPLYLYHIVSALDKVGLGAEARMIAAEAVARG